MFTAVIRVSFFALLLFYVSLNIFHSPIYVHMFPCTASANGAISERALELCPLSLERWEGNSHVLHCHGFLTMCELAKWQQMNWKCC